jgi:signal peptidase I
MSIIGLDRHSAQHTAEEQPTMTPTSPSVFSRGRKLWRELRTFVFIIVVFAALRSAVADWNDVPTGSMIPTILEGDRIFVNKVAYDLKVPFTTTRLFTWSNPKHEDVVVLFSPADGERLVKRIVAVPGDTIELRNNKLFLNGVPSKYSSLSPQLDMTQLRGHVFANETEPAATHAHAVMGSPNLSARRSFGPITVPADKYFVMGDNRDNSFDSRYFGFVDRSQIVGQAIGVVASLDLDHHWSPRWNRFLQPLK